MKRKPIYIAIEGIDGSGKTVQIAQLLEEILAAGYRCREVSFPQYDGFFGEQIGAMLSGRHSVRADEVDARSMALWYAADRMRTMRDICPDDYDYIILNRYTLRIRAADAQTAIRLNLPSGSSIWRRWNFSFLSRISTSSLTFRRLFPLEMWLRKGIAATRGTAPMYMKNPRLS